MWFLCDRHYVKRKDKFWKAFGDGKKGVEEGGGQRSACMGYSPFEARPASIEAIGLHGLARLQWCGQRITTLTYIQSRGTRKIIKNSWKTGNNRRSNWETSVSTEMAEFFWFSRDLIEDGGFGASQILSPVWCSPAGDFFLEKTYPWCCCSLKQCFLHSTETILDGTEAR